MMDDEIERRKKRLTTFSLITIVLTILFLILLLFSFYLLVITPTVNGYDGATLLGSPAPKFEFFDYQRKPHSQEELRGAVSFVLFWQPDDANCEQALSNLQTVYSTLADDGLKVVAIDIRARTSQALLQISRHELTFLFLEGILQKALDDWKIEGVPSIFLLDRELVVRRYFAGVDERSPTVLEAAARDLLDAH